MNTFLITGGWGYIGVNLVRKITENTHNKVIVIDPYSPDDIFDYLTQKVYWIKDTVSNLSKYEINVDYVFHLAGIANVKLSVDDPINDLNINLLETVKLLEWSRNKKIKKIIFSSSVSVLGSNINNPVVEESYSRPVSPYGASKSASENYLFAYFNSFKTPIVIARLFNVYGPAQKTLFFSDIVRKLIKNKEEIELWGGGLQIRDYLHINDVISGLILLSVKGLNGNVYNLSSGKPLKLIDLTNLISLNISNKFPKIISNESYIGDIPNWYGNIDKIKELGFTQSISLEDGVRSTTKWYLKNKKWLMNLK